MRKMDVLEIIEKNNGVISNKEAMLYGITRVTLHRLKEQGVLRMVSRGMYSLADEIPDMMWVLQNRCGKGTFSHETALYIHDLTDRTPEQHVMTIPGSYNASGLKALPVKFRYVKDELVDLGRTKVKTNQGNEVYAYDLERTICDIIKNKDSMDANIVNHAVREYVTSKKARLSLLTIYAKKMGISKKVNDMIEVLL